MKNNSLIVECLNIGPFQVNTYIIACPETRKACIIDPGGEEDRIIKYIENNKLTPVYILNTHGHRDHVPGNAALSLFFDVPVCMHTADITFFQEQTAFQGPEIKKNYAVDRPLKDNDTLGCGNLDIRVLHTPGHTPGSVCFHVGNCLFTGDTLFVGNAGRTDLPGGNLDTLIHSIKTRLMTLPPQTVIYPGHDYGDTPCSTMEKEQGINWF